MRPFAPLSTVILLWLAGLCAAAQYAKISVILPELAIAYPDAGSALGLLVSAVSIVGVLFGLIAGLLGLRIGLQRLLIGGLALGALVSLLQATLPPLPLLLASRVLEGASHLAIVVAAPTLIATLATQPMRGAAMTLWGTFFGVSFALTAWFGLPLVASRGPEALLMVHAGVTSVILLLLAIVLPDPPPGDCDSVEGREPGGHDRHALPSDGATTFSPRGLLARHMRTWRSPFVAAPAVLWLFYTLTFVALLAVLPGLVAVEERAFAATAMPLASIVCSLTIGVPLLRRLSAVQVVGTGFSLSILAALVLATVSPGTWAGIALFGALGLVQGASFASVPELNPTPADQTLANGALTQAGNLGNAIGTPLLVAVHAGRGVGAMMLVVVACYVAALAASALLAARRRRLGPISP